MSSRAKPFSGKKKKQQLQERRQRKAQSDELEVIQHPQSPKSDNKRQKYNLGNCLVISSKLISEWIPRTGTSDFIKPNENPAYSTPLTFPPTQSTRVCLKDFYEMTSLPIPTRPKWSSDMTKKQLEENESKSHKEWLKGIYESNSDLGFFEHNLEVWRQFWRVCEISDIIVVVMDVRFPPLHYPMSLHSYLSNLNKPVICTLMKCDLVDKQLVELWISEMKSLFGEGMVIVKVSVFKLPEDEQSHRARKKLQRYKDSSGVGQLLNACKSAANNQHSDEWDLLFRKRSFVDNCDESEPSLKKEYITIGMLGHPNVGKSSLINSIVGRTVVSASKTPGHTKHFQTIHLTKNIRLCDCPGLIFPVSLSRDLQVLNGLFNVAQLRDPFGSILVAASMVDLPSVLGLKLPDGESAWTMLLICEQYAIFKGFFTSKAGRPDIHRAANFLLRTILDGRVLIAWCPKTYTGSIARPAQQIDSSESEDDSEESVDSEPTAELKDSNRFFTLLDE